MGKLSTTEASMWLCELYFEAFAMVAADLRSKLEHGPDADGQKVKKIPAVERKARWEDVKKSTRTWRSRSSWNRRAAP